ncbi:MAG: hypothetical protein EHM40_16375 [Chloroflexi bacterium]|nr:MAG: hypothetical protein EHM40_16375 [Chloroflexota bacterium]
MLTPSDLLHLPYTRDLTEGGIACALHSLPYIYHRMGSTPYDHLRRVVAGGMVELAFRRYLSEQNIPFEVKGAAPFTEPDRYDVMLAGHRCNLKSFLISHRDQIAEIRRDPSVLLRAPALVASDQHAGDGHSGLDLYLFAFLPGLVTTSQSDLQKEIETKQPHYLIHVMPEAWKRPSKWNPLGRLVLKSEAEECVTLEIGGQAEGRERRSCQVELPPQTRLEIQTEFFSLSYIHIKSRPAARIGIHSPARRETHLIGALDWGNIWVYGMDALLAGYIGREEFSRCASFIQAGSRVFQYDQTHVKNLAVPVSDLKPLSELFERVKDWASQTTA